MTRNINQSHYIPGAANSYSSWKWDQSSFFCLTNKGPGHTDCVLAAATALCMEQQYKENKKVTMHIFWEGLCSHCSTDMFVHCRLNEWKGWQSCIAMANLHQSTTAAGDLRSEDASGETPTAPLLQSMQCLWLQIWQCSLMPVKNAWKLPVHLPGLECSHWAFWILIICVFQRPSSDSFRNHV